MKKEFKFMSISENNVSKQLRKLKKVEAPKDFEEKLFAKIANNEFSEEKKSHPWITASLSMAAGLLIAVFGFNFLSQTETNTNPATYVKTKDQEPKKDSIKTSPKTFDNSKLQLVGDKK
jgi:cytoskeletal protein RodZ